MPTATPRQCALPPRTSRGVVGVEEPHLPARLDVLQLDHRPPDQVAAEVGDRDAVGLDQLPHVGAPGDRVADRAAVEGGAGVDVPPRAGEGPEAGVLDLLELLEADHVEVGLADQRVGHAHPRDAGGVALLVAADRGRVRAAEHVEGADAERRLVGEAAAQPGQGPLELLGVLDVLRRHVGDDLGRFVGGRRRGLGAPSSTIGSARRGSLAGRRRPRRVRSPPSPSSREPIMPVAPPTKSVTNATTRTRGRNDLELAQAPGPRHRVLGHGALPGACWRRPELGPARRNPALTGYPASADPIPFLTVLRTAPFRRRGPAHR